MSNLTAGLVVVIALLGGFYGGFRYESGKVPASSSSAANPSGATAANAPTGRNAPNGQNTNAPNGGFGGGLAGRGGAGTITNLTSTGFTLHSANGTDVKVTFASGATVRKTADGQLSDLQNNVTVTVTGQRDADGNIAATAITIVPAATAATGGG
jgi:hypothetical protein